MTDAMSFVPDPPIRSRAYRIGCIGAGMIMAECHLAACPSSNYRAQGVGYAQVPPPMDRFSEQVWQHDMAADAVGEVPVALVNDALALGVAIVTHKTQFPCALQWQNFQSGNYTMGLEPVTHHVLGDLAARARGEMIWLGAQESRQYDTQFHVLAGAAPIADMAARIAAIASQPTNQYPKPSGNFPPLNP